MTLAYDINLKFWPWLFASIYLLLISILFLYKMRKTPDEIKVQRLYYRAIAIFIISYVISRIFFTLSDFERLVYDETDLYKQYVIIAYIVSSIGFINILYLLEKYLYRREKIILVYVMIVPTIAYSIFVFFPPFLDIIRTVNVVTSLIGFGAILILYLYLYIKSTGQVRKNTLVIVIGLLICAVGLLTDMEQLLSNGITQPYYAPILFSIGLSLFAYGQRKI